MVDIKGSIVALITPFNEDGSVNFDKIGELLDWHIENGTDGVVMLGTTSESSAMNAEEDRKIMELAVKKVNGRIPIIANAGSNDTAVSKRKAQEFEACGADALLCITPYYNKTNKVGMYHHFADVADLVKIPMILYNVPGRTGCSISIDVLGELAQHDGIMGIKEASGDFSYATEAAKLIGPDFRMYSGNDDTVVPLMSLGASGVISVWANLMPQTVHDMVQAWFDGDIVKARDIQLKYNKLIKDLFIEVNPIPVKEAMNLAGMGIGGYRQPLWEMSDEHKAELRREMTALGLL